MNDMYYVSIILSIVFFYLYVKTNKKLYGFLMVVLFIMNALFFVMILNSKNIWAWGISLLIILSLYSVLKINSIKIISLQLILICSLGLLLSVFIKVEKLNVISIEKSEIARKINSTTKPWLVCIDNHADIFIYIKDSTSSNDKLQSYLKDYMLNNKYNKKQNTYEEVPSSIIFVKSIDGLTLDREGVSDTLVFLQKSFIGKIYLNGIYDTSHNYVFSKQL